MAYRFFADPRALVEFFARAIGSSLSVAFYGKLGRSHGWLPTGCRRLDRLVAACQFRSQTGFRRESSGKRRVEPVGNSNGAELIQRTLTLNFEPRARGWSVCPGVCAGSGGCGGVGGGVAGG